MVLLWIAVATPVGAGAEAGHGYQAPSVLSTAYEGKIVRSMELPGVADKDRTHLLNLIPIRVDEPLKRDSVRDSIKTLYGTGRFADIQAEVTPSGDGVVLSFVTSPNFFVGAVEVEGLRTGLTQIRSSTRRNFSWESFITRRNSTARSKMCGR